MKQVDVDTLLAESELELILVGKKFKIKDVPMTTFMETAKDDMEKDKDLLHKQLAAILKVDKKEIKEVGIKAAGLALNAIREWLTGTSPEVEPEEKGALETKNP